MEFQITGHNIEVTPALRETVEKKLKKLEQLFDRINGIQVVLKVEKFSKLLKQPCKLMERISTHQRKKMICTLL